MGRRSKRRNRKGQRTEKTEPLGAIEGDASPPSVNPAPRSDVHRELDEQMAFAADILDKQYRNYAWNDVKMQALITANSILFAVIGFMFTICLTDRLATLCLLFGALLLSWSLIKCLLHAIPRLLSGRAGPDNNPRAISGITGGYDTWQDYLSCMRRLTKEERLTTTVRQVYGMASNNQKSHGILRQGVIATVLAVLLTYGAMLSAAAAGRGHHMLGAWSQPALHAGDSTKREVPGVTASQAARQPGATSLENRVQATKAPEHNALEGNLGTAISQPDEQSIEKRDQSTLLPGKATKQTSGTQEPETVGPGTLPGGGS